MGQLRIEYSGPGVEEIDGLELNDRKRIRTGHAVTMDTDNSPVNKTQSKVGVTYNEAGLSMVDCPASSQIDLAKIAPQASHPL